MLKTVRYLLALALPIASFECAPPAVADPALLQGSYSYIQDGTPTTTWTVSPTCVPVVGDLRDNLELPLGCVLHINSIAANPSDEDKPGLIVAGGDARLAGGLWSYTEPLGEGITCPDGSVAKAIQTVSFDGDALTGTRKTLVDASACGGGVPLETSHPFTLVSQGPLSEPIEPYPLVCEPGGLRRCY